MFFTVIGAIVTALTVSAVVYLLGVCLLFFVDEQLTRWAELTLTWIGQALVAVFFIWLQAQYLLPLILAAKMSTPYAVTGAFCTLGAVYGIHKMAEGAMETKMFFAVIPGLIVLGYLPVVLMFAH